MSIFVNSQTRVVVQGLTGRQGRFYGLRNKAYGTNVVAGVNAQKANTDVEGIPIFATVAEAVEKTQANTSFIIVPASTAADAILEAAAAGIALIVCVTEHIPIHDEARVYNHLKRYHPHTRLIGPNCSGILSPGICNIGFTPTEVALPGGPVGVISRSGTLAYQSLYELTQQGLGQTTCVGIGGDPIPGISFVDCLQAFEDDPETKAVILIGEIGGTEEEKAADFIASKMTKPVVAYIAGVTAPAGKKMGHAGAIVSGTKGSAKAKIEVLKSAGVHVAQTPTELGSLMTQVINSL
jgi:succinyl-CoA synthetase alpha subunit